MIIPMRCFTCGTPVAHLKDKYYELVLKYSDNPDVKNMDKIHRIDNKNFKETPECRALNELNLNRYCCRRLMLGHKDIIEIIN